MKILLIDDNKSLTEMFAKYFKLLGHECMAINDGVTGLNMILNQKWDVVLLDLAMPNFSGRDVIESLGKKDMLKDQKIIIFTASSSNDSEMDELIQKGVHSRLNKPIDLDYLITYISNLK